MIGFIKAIRVAIEFERDVAAVNKLIESAGGLEFSKAVERSSFGRALRGHRKGRARAQAAVRLLGIRVMKGQSPEEALADVEGLRSEGYMGGWSNQKTDMSRRAYAVGFALGTAVAQKGRVVAVASPMNETALVVVIVRSHSTPKWAVWWFNAATSEFQLNSYHDNEDDAWREFTSRVSSSVPVREET